MSVFLNSFGDVGPVIPRSLTHVCDHLGDGVIVVVDDIDAGLSTVAPVSLPLPLQHEVKIKREAVSPVDIVVVTVVPVIAT